MSLCFRPKSWVFFFLEWVFLRLVLKKGVLNGLECVNFEIYSLRSNDFAVKAEDFAFVGDWSGPKPS